MTRFAQLLIIIMLCVHCSDASKSEQTTKKENTYYRLTEHEGRDYLLTPSGNRYRALGINHFHSYPNDDYDRVIEQIKGWNFNAGCYQGPKWMWERYPYTKGINFVEMRSYLSPEKFRYEDVFDPAFLEKLEGRIKDICAPQAENENLIGYFSTDMTVWRGEKHGRSWVQFYRDLPAGSPGGQVWAKWKAENPDTAEQAFVSLIASQLYEKGYGFIRKYDSNHLLFSDRFNPDHLDTNVVRIALEYVDAIAFQPSFEHLEDSTIDFFASFGKPIYIADLVIGHPTSEQPVVMAPVEGSQEDFVAYWRELSTRLMARPDVIGLNFCQYIDEKRPTLVKQGMIKEDGTPHPFTAGIAAANRAALSAAYGE